MIKHLLNRIEKGVFSSFQEGDDEMCTTIFIESSSGYSIVREDNISYNGGV